MLEFQDRPDGYRVVVSDNGVERNMVASVQTRAHDGYVSILPMSNDEFEMLVNTVGVTKALAERDRRSIPGMTAKWVPLPRKECTVHSAGGAMLVEHLDEILKKIPAE